MQKRAPENRVMNSMSMNGEPSIYADTIRYYL